jgi:hypothetical protein
MKTPLLRSRSISVQAHGLFVAVLVLLAACACGETGVRPQTPAAVTADPLDGDPVALLPAGPILVVTVDAHAVYDSASIGADVGAVVGKFLPIATDVGFSPSRDIDRVVVGSYALQGVDVVAVVRGRFDAEQLVRVVGGALVSTPYADRQIYTAGTFGFTVLTPRTVLVGTSAGLRRALDRIHDARVKVELPAWMTETLATKDAAFALAADFGGAPLSGLRGLPLPPSLTGIQNARGVGDLHDPGMNLSGTVTFADAARATAGAEAMRHLGALVNGLAVTGVVPQLKDLTIGADGANVQVKFAVSAGALHSLLQQLPQYVGKPR